MDTDRAIFAEQIEHDRKLRRLAATLVPELLSLSSEEAAEAISKARKLVDLASGGVGPTKPVSAAAAELYAHLPLHSTRDALRTLHLIEENLRYIEEGVFDGKQPKDLARYLGGPIASSKHLRFNVGSAANDCDLIVMPDFYSATPAD